MEERRSRNYPPRRRRRRRRAAWPVYVLALGAAVLAGVSGIRTLVKDSMAVHAVASDYQQDVTPPTIEGVKDMTVYVGDKVLYLSEVTATDDRDPNPRLEANSSLVDLSTPGEYTVYYTARDASGNESFRSATVIVLEKSQDPSVRSQIDVAVDEVLEEIITPDMSNRQKVEAIYAWMKDNLSYGGHSDRSGYAQAGYEMLTTGVGDCYGYFGLTKLMLERLDIDNIDVEKTKDSPTAPEHYWNLISLDGGKTWYHYDATPRVGQTEELCLVTDTFLASFDTFHQNCHRRDMSLYPATPEGWQ